MSKNVLFLRKVVCFFLLALISIRISVASFASRFDSVLSLLDESGMKCVSTNVATQAPFADGVIGDDEYALFNDFSVGSGIFLYSSDGKATVSDRYSSMEWKQALCFDDTYAYFAMKLEFPDAALHTYPHPSFGNVVSVSVFLGLDRGEDPACRNAGLENVYYFSMSEPKPVAVSGLRLKYIGDRYQLLSQISSTQVKYSDTGFVDESGTTWTGEKYLGEAGLAVAADAGSATFECRIPLGDVLITVDEKNGTDALERLKNDSDFKGSLQARISLCPLTGDEYLLASLGRSALDEISDSEESFREALISRFGQSKNTAYAVEWIPSVFSMTSVSAPSLPSQTDSDGKDGSGSETDPEIGNQENPFTDKPSVDEDQPSVPKPLPETGATVDDESVFDGLPDADDPLPENTEVLEIEAEEGSGSTLISSVMLLIAGIFMIASVIAVAYFFFKKEKEEKNNEKAKKSSR